ncbi:MAG: SusC/RagA family TonB-linked outer membrane protein [Bacteroidales bacterium]|nr:SusC/RagA family TonB-linked outer membrane protein [Bacteroidales bacterium]
MKKLLVLMSLLALNCAVIFSQTRTIKGNVIGDDGLPIPGASVVVKGSTTGTITDFDGNFTLSVSQDATTIVVHFVGYADSEITLNAQTSTYNVVLKVDSEELEEIVVTGMHVMDKRLFTGATTKLSAKDVMLDGIPDVSRALEGRAAGVSVQNVSGTFGTAPKIRVRGATSIYGSSKPLWVVDGVIMEDVTDISADDLSSGDPETLLSSAISGLNSDDIESFQVLKDGSATSIYGARAMAGVIVITTKKGKAGQSKISYTGEYTTRLKPSYALFNIMNSQDQMSVYQELQQKGYLNYATVSNSSESGVYGKMYELISEYDATSGKFGLENTEEARAAYLRAAEYRNTDWFDMLFSTALMHNHSLSISNGTEKGQTYASLSAMFDPGWTKSSSVQRYTANLNANYDISKYLSVNLISNASWRKQKAPGTLGSSIDAVNGEVKRDFDINPYSYAINTSRTLDPDESYVRNYAPFNIFRELKNNYMDLAVKDIRLQGELTIKPIQNVSISGIAAVKHTGTTQEHYILDESNQAMAYRAMATSTIRDNNSFLYKDPDNIYALPISVLPHGGIYERSDRSMTGYDFRATLSYNDVIKENNIVNLYAGVELNKIDRHSSWFRGWGMQYSLGEIASYAYQVFKKGQEENTEYFTMGNTHERSVAYFGTATYSWKGKYTLNGTYRYEGTNKLGKSRSARWMPTWNISGAWNAHEEEFWADSRISSILSHASLKASYSLTADRGPSNVTNSNVVIKSTTPWRPTTSVNESSLNISQLQNSELSYEKKHEFNLGFEMGFLNNRINFTGDIYWRNNYDLIGRTTTQGIGGEVQKYGNVATMKSNGAELSISATPVKVEDFSWNVNFIYSYTHNEVTKLENVQRMIDLVSGTGFALEGYPVRSIFSIQFKGLNEQGLPTFLDQDGNISTTGIYFQTTESEKLKKCLVFSGSADPTKTGSLGNTFRWKGLSLNVFVTYSFGNVVRLDPVFRKSYTDLASTPKEFNNRWVVPGDEKVTNVPVIASRRQNKNDTYLSLAYNAYNYSTERIAKGDFVRMKEISLGYEFPRMILDRLNVTNMSLKVQATNLFLIYADKKLNGQDPEFFNTGGVAIPVPRQFTMTLKVGI